MEDYFSDNEQWERLKEWLRENGLWIVAGLLIGALAIGGYRWWQARADRRALEAGALYEQVLHAFNHGNRAQGLSLIGDLSAEYAGSPYVDQANLAAAREFVEANELPEAAKRLSEVMRKSHDPILATVARLRLARVEIGMGRANAALATLGSSPAQAFASLYHEIRGDAYYAKGNKREALREYQAALINGGSSGAEERVLKLKIEDLQRSAVASPTKPAAGAKGTVAPAQVGR